MFKKETSKNIKKEPVKYIYFGKNNYATAESLSGAHAEIDLVNGIHSKYLGVINVNDKNVLITMTGMSGRGEHDGEIALNEVASNIYSDGSTELFINNEKATDIARLQAELNRDLIKDAFLSGKTVKDIFPQYANAIGLSNLKNIIESHFEETVNSDTNEVEKMQSVTGIPNDAFTSLTYFNKRCHISMYDLNRQVELLEQELEELKNQIQR